MNIINIENFKCPECGKLFEFELEAKSCIRKHISARNADKKARGMADEVILYQNFVLNNLKSISATELSELLSQLAAKIGFDLTFSTFHKTHSYYDDRITYDVRGNFTKSKNLKKPESLKNWSFGVWEHHQDPSFSEFIQFITGLDTGCGGGRDGDGGFYFTVYLCLSYFPVIKSSISELETLRKLKTKMNGEKNRLRFQYEKDWKPILLQSDVECAILGVEIEEISNEISVMKLKLDMLRKQQQTKLNMITANHSPKYCTPDSSFDFDEAKLMELEEWISK